MPAGRPNSPLTSLSDAPSRRESPATLGVPNYFSGGLIYVDLLGIVIYTLMAMGFRFWLLRAEESLSAPREGMTLRSALLLYRLTGIRARIARIVFWLWVVLSALVVVDTVISAVDDPRVLPSNLVSLVAWIGWGVGLRYWAVSHCERAAAARADA